MSYPEGTFASADAAIEYARNNRVGADFFETAIRELPAAPSGNSVFFSGQTGHVNSGGLTVGQINQNLTNSAASGADVLGQTELGQFLAGIRNDVNLNQAVRVTFDRGEIILGASDFGGLIGDPAIGTSGTGWVTASQRFAADASGDVFVLLPQDYNADGTIFGDHELDRLLNNDAVDTINGVSRTELLALGREGALAKIEANSGHGVATMAARMLSEDYISPEALKNFIEQGTPDSFDAGDFFDGANFDNVTISVENDALTVTPDGGTPVRVDLDATRAASTQKAIDILLKGATYGAVVGGVTITLAVLGVGSAHAQGIEDAYGEITPSTTAQYLASMGFEITPEMLQDIGSQMAKDAAITALASLTGVGLLKIANDLYEGGNDLYASLALASEYTDIAAIDIAYENISAAVNFISSILDSGSSIDWQGINRKINQLYESGAISYDLAEKLVNQQVMAQALGWDRDEFLENVSDIFVAHGLEKIDGTCFPAGTLIEMADGSSLPIEEVREADWVMSFDPSTLTKIPKQVVRLFHGETNEWIVLDFEIDGDQRQLTTTPNHPFLKPDGTFAPIAELIDASGHAELVLQDGGVVEAKARLVTYTAETADLYEQTYALASSGSAALAPVPTGSWGTYNFEVRDTHTYLAEQVCVHNRCLENFVTENTLNALVEAGIVSRDDAYYSESTGQWLVRTPEGGIVTEGALEGQPIVKIIEVFSDFAEHVGHSITQVFEDIGGYLEGGLQGLFTDLLNGEDFETSVEAYTKTIVAEMGVDVLANIFGLQDLPRDIHGNPTIPDLDDPKFFDTEIGGAIKGALVSAATMRLITGEKLTSEDYEHLALNHSVKFLVTKALQTQPWALNELIPNNVANSKLFEGIFDHASGAPVLSLGAQSAASAAVSLLVDLFDGGIEDPAAALGNAAIAAGSTYLSGVVVGTYTSAAASGAAAGSWSGGLLSSSLGNLGALAGPVGFLISAAIGVVLGKLFGELFSPPPPLVTVEENDDGTVTVYITENSGGYIYLTRDGHDDILVGSSGHDALVGSSGDNELHGQDGDDHLEGRAGDDLLTGGKGKDAIYGGAGDDEAIGGQGHDTVDGGDGNDIVIGGDGDDVLFGDSHMDEEDADHAQRSGVSRLGEQGDPEEDDDDESENETGAEVEDNSSSDPDATHDDVLLAGAGNDKAFAGKGNDYVNGSFGDDVLMGQDGDDVVMGGEHDDFVDGGAGNDVLDGEAGSDKIYGGAGDDVAHGDKMVVLKDTPVTSAIRNWLDTQVKGSNDLKDTLGINKAYHPVTTLNAAPFAGAFTLGDLLLTKVSNVETALIAGLEGETDEIFDAFMTWLASSDASLKSQIESGGFDYLASDYEAPVDDPDTEVDEAETNPGQMLFTLGGGNDLIDLGAGNDLGYGGHGHDTLKGGDGDDVLYGDGLASGTDEDGNPIIEDAGAGNDKLYGGAGNDQITAGDGNNTVEGGDGDDRIFAGSGADNIKGGAGADIISSGDGDDVIYAGDSGVPEEGESETDFSLQDIVNAGAGNDIVYGEGGADYLSGGTGNDKLYGGEGNDNLSGDEGNDELRAGAGDDVLNGGDGQDTLFGEAGNDILNGGAGNDDIYGGDGNDIVQAGLGNDLVQGGSGSDTILGEIGDDTLSGGEGDDLLSGGSDNDVLNGDAGNDTLDGGSGNDELFGGVGDDELIGGAGSDTLSGGDGGDTIYGDEKDGLSGGSDQIDAGNGDDIVHGGIGDDNVQAGLGNDEVNAGSGNDVVSGGDGNDTLNGDAGNDQLSGGAGNDQMSGGSGNDTLDGGAGDDVIDGGSGNDQITAGSGNDQVTDTSGADTVDLGAGDDRFTSNASDTLGDTVDGGDGNDDLTGGAGNDRFLGGAGNDNLKGGAGQDILNAGDGNDTLDGGADADTLISGRGIQVLKGGDGNDLYQIDLAGLQGTIEDTSGVDKIELSGHFEPKDILLEKDGNDLLLRSRSNPNDHIRIVDQFAGTPKIEAVSFASHTFTLDLTNVIIGTDGNDNIEGTENNDIVLALAGDDIVVGAGGDDFLDGGPGKDVLFGNDGNDLLHGSSEDDLLNGGVGADLINDGTGSDMLIGGEGSDTFALTENAGDHDTIADFAKGQDKISLTNFGNQFVSLKQMEYFGADFAMNGSDAVLTFDGNQKVTIEDVHYNSFSESDFEFDLRTISGTSGTSLNEIITGGSGADIIQGGSGFDIMTGGAGADTFIIGRDAGDIDQITDFNVSHDVIDLTAFSDNVSVHQFEVAQRGADVTISFGANQHLILENVQKDQLTLDNFKFDLFEDQTNVSRYNGNILHNLASDTVIEAETQLFTTDVEDAAESLADQIADGAGADAATGSGAGASGYGISGTSYGTNAIGTGYIASDAGWHGGFNSVKSNNAYYKRSGCRQKLVKPESFSGTVFDDLMYGNYWSEKIYAGHGDDVVYAGNGNDVVYASNGNDYVNGGSGNDIIHGSNSNSASADYNYYMQYGACYSRLVNGGFAGWNSDDDYLVGGDGDDKIYGGYGDDKIYGGNHNDYLVGGTGNDQIYGGDHNDVIHGEWGNDLMYGGTGADLIYGGSGNDTGYGGTHNDTMYGGDGHDILHGESGNDYIDGGNHNDYITGGDGYDQLYGGAGNDDLHGGNHNDTLHGGSGNDELQGNHGDDHLDGSTGNDYVRGGDGNDRAYGGDGEDQVIGDSGNDFLYGGNDNDVLYGGLGDDREEGGAGNDMVFGHDGDDTLLGQDGNDYLDGNSGNDAIDGGAGNDDIYGSEGNDSIYGQDGSDKVYGGNGNDLVDGGTGNDYVMGDAGNDHLYGGDGNDYVRGHNDHDTLYGGNGNDILLGEHGNDIIYGSNGEDILNGGDGSDRLYGGENDDTFLAGTGNDTADGGSGNDLINGQDGNDNLLGGSGNDHLLGESGNDVIQGHSGSDLIEGGTGDDYLEGDEDRDVIFDTSGANFIHGGSGADYLAGGAGNEVIHGGGGSDLIGGFDGSDYIDGGTNGDVIDGGDGHDHLLGGQGNDEIYGGNGDDLIQGGTEHDELYGGNGKDLLEGEAGNDWLVGGAQNDILKGGTGNDMLAGGSGGDRLFGGEGSDMIVGGAGADLLYGGSGADVFNYDALTESTATSIDVIADFNRNEDKIDLTDFDIAFDDLDIAIVNGETEVSVEGTDFKLRILGDDHDLSAAQFNF